jgi:hypothetical protein
MWNTTTFDLPGLCPRFRRTAVLTFFHLLLFAFKRGRNVAGVLLRQHPVMGAWNSQMCGLRRGLPARSADNMIEVFVMREPLETEGGSSA